MDFVLKDNPAEAEVKIKECLLNAMERYTLQTNRTHKVYTLESGGRKISIDYDDILFLRLPAISIKSFSMQKTGKLSFSAP